MYSSTKSYTLACAEGTTGTSVTKTATATSIISQIDADLKAQQLAQLQAFEEIRCLYPFPPEGTFFYNDEQSTTLNSDVGMVVDTFTGTVPAGAVYSTVSEAAANAAALAESARLAALAKLYGQRILYSNTEQTFTAHCDYPAEAVTETVTVTAGTYTSPDSQTAADHLAFEAARTAAFAALDCSTVYFSTSQSYTATCPVDATGVGSPVTVTNPASAFISTVSQADANSLSLADATARAIALLSCAAGYYNTDQTYTAACSDQFGVGWVGSDSSVTVPAGTYFAASQLDADNHAMAVATSEAINGLNCTWTGGSYYP